MGPLVIGALGLAGVGAYKLFAKKATQGMPSGTPGVFIVAPVPGKVTHAQQSATVLKPAQSASLIPVISPAPGVTHAPISNTVKPDGGIVYGPPDAVQPGQSLPIVVTPTGASAIGLSSTSDVQKALNALGILPRLKEDGALGPATAANIKSFQSSHGMVVDGNAGPAMKAALSAALSALAAGPKAVIGMAANSATPGNTANLSNKDIQHILNILGANPPLKEDGVLGPKAVSAVKAFQVSHGLTPDGVAGPKTKAALAIASKGN